MTLRDNVNMLLEKYVQEQREQNNFLSRKKRKDEINATLSTQISSILVDAIDEISVKGNFTKCSVVENLILTGLLHTDFDQLEDLD